MLNLFHHIVFIISVFPQPIVFSKVMETSLVYARGCAFGNSTVCAGTGEWVPWLTTNVYPNPPSVNMAVEKFHPQAIFADIEFDDNNNMIIGLRDSFGDKCCNQAPNPENGNILQISDAIGDILLATPNGAGTLWSVNLADFTDNTASIGQPNPPGETIFGDDFYSDGSFIHEETAMGGLGYLARKDMLVTPSMDPRLNAFSNGIDWFDMSTANKDLDKSITVITGATSPFGKSYGLGEVEFACQTPLEVGNRIWLDVNTNGIQDPGESGHG